MSEAKETANRQKQIGDDQDRLLGKMWELCQLLVKLAKFKLSVLGVLAVVVLGIIIATTNNGNNISEVEDSVIQLERQVEQFDVTVTSAKQAAEDAKVESREARRELNEAIRLVQENPNDPTFVERVEEGLRRIQEVDERLVRIEALLNGER